MSRTPELSVRANAPWHRRSFDKFINDSLPRLLAERLPIASYSARPIGDYECSVRVTVGEVEAEYTVLQPDDEGLFRVDGGLFVVVPIVTDDDMAAAKVECAGEQMLSYIEARLGAAQADLPWDEQLVRAWLPLDAWVRSVVTSGIEPDYLAFPPAVARRLTGQWLDTTNGVAAATHLRRVVIPDAERSIHPSQFGRVCPFETPEGPNIGRVFSVATGATIVDGRFEVVDDAPESSLGLTASMVPFLEHNDANRQLMGVNMMRQWRIPDDPEPAFVQTGREPDFVGVWCGRNLLTAFVALGPETYEDSIVVSESAARRLSYPDTAQVGDKLSNRHGSKGVIGRILPDREMPRLPDGTPVELVYNFIGVHARQNLGQLREAVMGRIARAEGEPAVVPPFHAPGSDELRARLRAVGLPEDGMEALVDGRSGRSLERRSTVGWVYWGRTVHTSASKVHCGVYGDTVFQGRMEYRELRDMGCLSLVNSMFNACSEERTDRDEFVRAVESGLAGPSGAPTPRFEDLRRRLDAAGVKAVLGAGGVRFGLGDPSGETLRLAQPVEHPWLPGRTLCSVGVYAVPQFAPLADANARAARAVLPDAPASLKSKALAALDARVAEYVEALVTPDDVCLRNKVMFSGRTVIAPSYDLRLDQVGLAEEIAWTIFAPLVVREIGDRSKVEARTEEAARALDDIMERSWVVVNRAPTTVPTALMAFHPVRIPEPVIRIHPLVCYLMNADFDGDQVAVFLPVTDDAQREAGEKLSFAGHLRRDPGLYGLRFPYQDVLWGLADLSLTTEGLREIREAAGAPVSLSGGIVTRETIAAALREVEARDGIDATLDALQRLMILGFRAARLPGASISPFSGATWTLPPLPEDDDRGAWDRYSEEVIDLIEKSVDYASPDLGPQVLAVKSGARGYSRQLLRIIGAMGPVTDVNGRTVFVRSALMDGYSPEESFACVAGHREALARFADEVTRGAYGLSPSDGPKGFGVLARAMRAQHPGALLTRAAASGEIDPLTDLDSRLFVGVP